VCDAEPGSLTCCIIFISLLQTDGTKIQKYELCDFRPMWEYFEIEKERKKGMTKDEKKALKAEKDALEENYKTCLLDGRKEKVGNFRVEPPSLFRGRGEHPKTGMLKVSDHCKWPNDPERSKLTSFLLYQRRVQPEQITINIGADAKVPEPPEGHQWGSVQHDNTVSWLAMWKENINGAFKYVFLGASSSLKGQSDMKKFETARKLKVSVARK
jgi:DNA topoisomerase-1